MKRAIGMLWILGLLACFTFVQAEQSPQLPAFQDFEELSLEELLDVVMAAAKHEQTTSEAPSSVTIITEEDIRHYGFRTLDEVLNAVRGFYVSYDRNYHYLGARGFSRSGDFGSRTLLLFNGHTINEPIYSSPFFEEGCGLDLSTVKRIEIVRGPGSALYGTNALFAVINVVTKEASEMTGLRLSGEARSYQTMKGVASYGLSVEGGPEIFVLGARYDSRGQDLKYPAFAHINDGISTGADAGDSYDLQGSLTYKDLILRGHLSSFTKEIPNGAWQTLFGDERSWTTDERSFVELTYTPQLNATKGLQLRAYYDHYHYTGDYLYGYCEDSRDPEGDYEVNDPAEADYLVLWEEDVRARWAGTELQYHWKVLPQSRLTLGAEYQKQLQVDQRAWWDEEEIFSDSRSQEIKSIYLQEEHKFGKTLNLTVGLRHDHYGTFGGTTNPRVAAVYSPQARTHIKLLYGRAFRAPNPYELFWEDEEYSKLNPDLQPERIDTYELVLEQGWGSNLRGLVSVYHYDMWDLINEVLDETDGLFQQVNVGEVKANGIELELRGRWPNGLKGHLSYAYQRAVDKEIEDDMTNSPRHLAKSGLTFPVLKRMAWLGVEVQYMGKRLDLEREWVDDYLLTNVTISSRRLMKGVELSASVRNLFDQRYVHPGNDEHRTAEDVYYNIPQDCRNFRLNVAYTVPIL